MKEDRKRELEAKLFQLIAESNKPKKIKTRGLKTSSNIRVIRRRKGNPDQFIV